MSISIVCDDFCLINSILTWMMSLSQPELGGRVHVESEESLLLLVDTEPIRVQAIAAMGVYQGLGGYRAETDGWILLYRNTALSRIERDGPKLVARANEMNIPVMMVELVNDDPMFGIQSFYEGQSLAEKLGVGFGAAKMPVKGEYSDFCDCFTAIVRDALRVKKGLPPLLPRDVYSQD